MSKILLVLALLTLVYAFDERARLILLHDDVIDTRTANTLQERDLEGQGLALYLLKFSGIRTSRTLREQIQNTYNMKLRSYVPYNTYVVALTPTEALELSNTPGIAYVGRYLPRYKISRNIDSVIKSHYLNVLVSGSYSSKANSLNFDNLASGCVVDVVRSTNPDGVVRKLTIKMDQSCNHDEVISYINTLSEHPAIEFIEAKPVFKFNNYFAHGLVQSNKDPNVTTGAIPFFVKGINGTGHVIGCGDTGIDVHNCFFYDADHEVSYYTDPNADPVPSNHRKIAGYMAFADDQDYVGGHGTHVSGSLAGMMSSDKHNHEWYKFHGNAPEAKIAFFDIGNGEDISTPSSLLDYFPFSNKLGARVHSNSWGSDSAAYTTESSEVDEYMYKNQDFLVLFAAGNAGDSGPYTVGSPATAKNILTIGAAQTSNGAFQFQETHKDVQELFNMVQQSLCEEDPAAMGYIPQVCTILGTTVPCSRTVIAACDAMNKTGARACCNYKGLVPFCCPDPDPDVWAHPEHYNDNNLAYFTSQGPTTDMRYKPDVTCPGLNVWSAKSHGERDESTVDMCGTNTTSFESAILSMAGTSMATPVCAGNMILLREYLMDGYIHDGTKNPTYGLQTVPAALMKALAINGAKAHTGVYQEFAYEGGPYSWLNLSTLSKPNMYEGYGKVDLVNTVPHMDATKPGFNVLISRSFATSSASDELTSFDTKMYITGENARAMCFKVVNASYPVVMTMNYLDVPSRPDTRMAIVDDFDLIVYHNGARVKAGGLVQTEDRLNPTEHAEFFNVAANDAFVAYVSALNIVPMDENDLGVHVFVVASGGIVATECPTGCAVTCHHGKCDSYMGVCECEDGIAGLACDLTPCPNDCSSSGTCNYTTGVCKCMAGYAGDDCSEPVACPNNCSHHGVCADACVCNAGWFGSDCSVPICTGQVLNTGVNGTFSITAYTMPRERVKCTYAITPPAGWQNVTLQFTLFNTTQDIKMTVLSADLSDGMDISLEGEYIGSRQPFSLTTRYPMTMFDLAGFLVSGGNVVVNWKAVNYEEVIPEITSVKPNFATFDDMELVIITGKMLCSESQDSCQSSDNCSIVVMFAGVQAEVSSIHCGADSTIYAFTNRTTSARSGDVVVLSKNTGKRYALTDGFEYIEPVHITSIVPRFIPVNMTGRITLYTTVSKYDAMCEYERVSIGSCYGENAAIVQREPGVAVLEINSTECIDGPGRVYVSVNFGACGSMMNMELLVAGTPGVISSVSPATGPLAGGTRVTISGDGLGYQITHVTFAGVNATILLRSSTEVVVTTPCVTVFGLVDVVVFGDDTGWTTKTKAFNYFDTLPHILSISPNTGSIYGGQFSISGVNFNKDGLHITFDNVNVTLLQHSDTAATVHAPGLNVFTTSKNVDVCVHNSAGSGCTVLPFVVRIDKAEPHWAHIQQPRHVVLAGVGLCNDTNLQGVTVASLPTANVKHTGTGRIEFDTVATDKTKTGPIKVSLNWGQAVEYSSSFNFTFCDNCPMLSKLVPDHAPTGKAVISQLYGAVLNDVETATLGGHEITGTPRDSGHITLNLPSLPKGKYDLVLGMTNQWAPGPEPIKFEFTGPGVIADVSPRTAPHDKEQTVVIKAEYMFTSGSASDIISVTLAGVHAKVVSVTSSSITVTTGTTGSAKSGDVVIESIIYGTMTKAGGFAYTKTESKAYMTWIMIGAGTAVVAGVAGFIVVSGSNKKKKADALRDKLLDHESNTDTSYSAMAPAAQ